MPARCAFRISLLLSTAVLLVSACGGGGLSVGTGSSSPSPGRSVAVPARPQGGINANPSMRPWRYLGANPDGWFDPAAGPGRIDAELTLMAAAGADTVRIEFPWYLIEPSRKGEFDWAVTDHIVSKAQALGLVLTPVLVYTPHWASPVCTNPAVNCSTDSLAATCPAAPPSARDFGDFAGAIATRYRGRVRYWEMWNEPDLPKYFNGSPGDYVKDVLVPGYTAVKAADPAAKVILAGFGEGGDVNWTSAVIGHGGKGYFDIVAFHDYSGDAATSAAQAAALSELAPHVPIWLGEYGVQEGNPDVKQQALMKAVLGEPSQISMAQWYNLRDDAAMAGPGAVCSKAVWGLVGTAEAGYPRKDGFAVMRYLLRGA